LIFELSNYSGSKYIGIQVDSPINGLANAKYQRFLLHKDLDVILGIMGLGKSDLNEYNCGDYKLFFSYYNRADSSQLPYGYAGKNYNTVSKEVLD
jgi:hypothetical protein